jgi:hypothetical protein
MKVKISKKDARVLNTLTQVVGGSPVGPRGALDRLAVEFRRLGYTKRAPVTFKNCGPSYVYIEAP